MFAGLLDLIPSTTPAAVALSALALAVLITGVAKSGFGGGVGILAVPLVAVALDAAVAVGVMLPILIAADMVAVLQHRRDRSGFHLKWSLAGGVVGILLGSMLLWGFTQGDAEAAQRGDSLKTALNLTVGGVCVLLVALQVYRMAGGRVPGIPRHRGAGLSAGGVAGFVSTLAHAAGPVMTVYILDQGLEKRRVVGTLVLFFFVLNLLKLPTFVGLGLITLQTLGASIILIPLVPLGSLLGLWLNRVIPEKPFTLVMYIGAGAAGVWLVAKGLLA
ncbi:MAG: sulfite exporter TauE/SafE family protein [Planctomycetota bacterium]